MDVVKGYEVLKAARSAGLGSIEVTEAICEVASASLNELSSCKRDALVSEVKTKEYFVFRKANKISRPVRADLFQAEVPVQLLQMYRENAFAGVPDDQLHKLLYTIAMCYCAAMDVRSQGDKKTPGTYFEMVVGNLFARQFDAEPKEKVKVLNLDKDATLPTDFIFSLGEGRAWIHLPVKLSTRERGIQVWAHQRVLDSVYGVGRFRGVLVVLSETTFKKPNKVIEVCVPEQWSLHQMFIAQLHRVYYLDVPEKYAQLGLAYPFIQVKSLVEFLNEKDKLVSAGVAST